MLEEEEGRGGYSAENTLNALDMSREKKRWRKDERKSSYILSQGLVKLALLVGGGLTEN